MYLKENIRLAWEGLKTNKMRALLTMLGIIIGIASVIAILTAGDGMTNSVTGQMGGLGTANINIMLVQKENDYSVSTSESDKISDEMLFNLNERFGDEIAGISLSENAGNGRVVNDKDYANLSLLGINDDYMPVNNTEIIAGRYISLQDIEGARNVAIVSDKFVENIFGSLDYDAIGEKVDVYLNDEIYTFSIIGVYEYVASTFDLGGSDEDVRTNMYVPLSVANRITGSGEGYTDLIISANDATNSESLSDDIQAFLNNYYINNANFEIATLSMSSMLDTLDTMLSTLSIGLSVIAGISLLVGGIGVMNIMLVSVTERTREIGTRKALGATATQIRVQFVMESLIVCSIGGAIGMILGGGFGYLASSLIGAATFPSLSSILISVLVSVAIGVFFGYYPANKAAKLDPIEALRYE